jgi:predicted amidohydrolase YtcJ
VVLDRDPVACPPDELPQLTVIATLLGGRNTHVLDPGIPGIECGS